MCAHLEGPLLLICHKLEDEEKESRDSGCTVQRPERHAAAARHDIAQWLACWATDWPSSPLVAQQAHLRCCHAT